MERFYRVHEFAALAGVTVRALHHYDRLGLLKPRRSESGYRIYREEDLERLEQIVALSFLGIPLRQIRTLLDRDALRLPEALGAQRAVLEEKRRLLDRAIGAIQKTEELLRSGQPAGTALLKEIIEAIAMQTGTHDATDFMKNYYREEAWTAFRSRHLEWPSREWRDLFSEVQQSLAEDPGSDRAQDLAARWWALRVADSAGDPKVHGGLIKAWADRQYWPDETQHQFADLDLNRISEFMSNAFAAYRRRHYGEIAWVKELACFAPEERERFPLAVTDLYFKVDEALDQDPASEAGRALAARWMELVESRTGGQKGAAGSMESYIKWVESWPPELNQRIRGLHIDRILEFIVRALAEPMRSSPID